jgi:DNA invertase Pin-like site-specific DNA recombinase
MKEFALFPSDMDNKGIGGIAVKNRLVTVSSSGRMMMKLIGVLIEWNREMFIERTIAGLARTVANGTKLGRKRITNDTMTAQVIELKN